MLKQRQTAVLNQESDYRESEMMWVGASESEGLGSAGSTQWEVVESVLLDSILSPSIKKY